jgi:hypothetical protein
MLRHLTPIQAARAIAKLEEKWSLAAVAAEAASVLVLHSVEENPQMSLKNRALQTRIEFIIIYCLIGFANNKQTVGRIL